MKQLELLSYNNHKKENVNDKVEAFSMKLCSLFWIEMFTWYSNRTSLQQNLLWIALQLFHAV